MWTQPAPHQFRTKTGAFNLARRLKKQKSHVFVTTIEVVKVTEENLTVPKLK
jgi:hypothetical protein